MPYLICSGALLVRPNTGVCFGQHRIVILTSCWARVAPRQVLTGVVGTRRRKQVAEMTTAHGGKGSSQLNLEGRISNEIRPVKC